MFKGAGWLSRFRLSLKMSIAVLSAVLVFLMLARHLGSLTAGLSPNEVAAKNAAGSWNSILDNPLNLPHKLVAHFLSGDGSTLALVRLSSVLFAVFFLICAYMFLRAWFGELIAFGAALLLLSLPWFVLQARSATTSIMYLAPLAIFTSFSYLLRPKINPGLTWLLFCVAVGLSLYTPGVAWLVIIGVLLTRQQIGGVIRRLDNRLVAGGLVLFIALLSPLIRGFILKPALLYDWLLLPSYWPGFTELLKSVGWMFLSLAWRTRSHSDFLIGRLPLFNAAQLALIVFGLYALFERLRKAFWLALILVIGGVILSGISANLQSLGLVIGPLIILAAAGLRYLYVEWLGVFPYNPIPRGLALFLLSVLVAMNLGFGWRYALTAWPATTDTKQTYVLK